MYKYEEYIDDRKFKIVKISCVLESQCIGYIEVVNITLNDWNISLGTMKQFKDVFSDLDCQNEKEWISDYNRIKEFFVDKPSTEYIFVEDDFRHKSYGKELYKEALRYFQSLGYTHIYSDNIRSDDSNSLLLSLESEGVANFSGDRFIIG